MNFKLFKKEKAIKLLYISQLYNFKITNFHELNLLYINNILL